MAIVTKAENQLKPKQLLFLKLYLESQNAKDAYLKAGYKTNHPEKAASQLLNNPKIQFEIDKIRSRIEQKIIVTFQDKTELLWSFAQEPELGVDARIKAIQELNKMQGHLAPEKQISINVDSTIEQLKNIRLEYKDH